MNRLLSVPHHPAIVRAAQHSLASSSGYLGVTASFSALGSLLPCNWFSTAAAAPRNNAAGDDALQNPGGSQSSTTPHASPGAQRPAVAAGGAGAVAAASPSAPSSSTGASTPPAAPSILPDSTPQRIDHDAPAPPGSYWDPAHTAAQPQLLQVVPTPEGAPRDKLLLRDFIQNSLYHPTLGYFNAPTPPVGSMGNPINYWRIYCRDEFNIMIKKKYQELETSFLTPAELFSPWYGACIARHMVEHRRHHLAMEGQPLLIVEVGGGNGTLARDILDWLRDNRPQDYRQTSYTCLEISTSLAARQYDKVVRQGGHGGRFHLRRGSGLDPATWGPERRWDHTFVLMMEVLDNLPHDRVFRRRPSDPWQQAVVRPAAAAAAAATGGEPTGQPGAAACAAPGGGSYPTLEHGPWQEAGEPLSDPLLLRTLAAVYRPLSREQQLDERFNRVLDFILARDAQPNSRDEVLWLPTACAAFLELLHSQRPNHSLIAADFDKLPDVQLAGRNAPLIAQKVGGRNIDHGSLLIPWGTADIFFPTDFDALCDLYRTTAEHVWGGGGGDAAAGAASTAADAAAAAAAAAAGGVDAVAGDAGGGAALGDINAEHFRQGAVIKRYREMFNTATICSFNPMVDDFVNARFFFGDSKNRYPPGQRPAATQGKARMPQAPPSLASGIKSHIPAAPASKGRPRSQQQQGQQGQGHVQQQQTEPVLGGRRQRGGDGGGKGRGGPRG